MTGRMKYDTRRNVIWGMTKAADEGKRRYDIYGYTGKEREQEIGLAYFGARWYNADMGRYISCDPSAIKIEEPVNINKYQYCANNPLKYVDPTGLSWIPLAKFQGSFIMGNQSGRKRTLKEVLADKITEFQSLAPKVIKEVENQLSDLQDRINSGTVNDVNDIGAELERIMSMVGLFEFSLDIFKDSKRTLKYEISTTAFAHETNDNEFFIPNYPLNATIGYRLLPITISYLFLDYTME